MAVIRVTFILPWLSLYPTAHGSEKWSERAKVFYLARPVNKSETRTFSQSRKKDHLGREAPASEPGPLKSHRS